MSTAKLSTARATEWCTSAEVVWAYLTDNVDFEEKHTGLEDVKIEVQIMAHCFRQHKKMDKGINRLCWRTPQADFKELLY